MILVLQVENTLTHNIQVDVHFFTYKNVEMVTNYQVPPKTVKQTLPEKFDINKEQFFYNIHSINVSEKNMNPIKITRNEMKKVEAMVSKHIITLCITSKNNLYRISFR